jgi:hypothetical protein
MAAMALFWIGANGLILLPCKLVPTMTWWPALLCAAAMACFQAISWTLAGSPLLRLVVALGVLPGWVLACVLYCYSHGISVTVSELSLILCGVILAAYGVSVVGVSRGRRGEALGWAWVRQALERAVTGWPRRRRLFRTPARAQAWLEWRQKGLLLPFFVGCFILFLLAVAGLEMSRAEVIRVFLAFLSLPLLVAFFVGFGTAKTSFWARELGLSSFAATRPLSSSALVAAKLRTAARSTVATWALILLLASCWVVLSGNAGLVQDLWDVFILEYRPVRAWVIPPLALAGAVALTWMQLVAGLVLGLTGRPWVVNGAVSVYLALATAGACLGIWTYFHPDFYDTFLAVLWWLAGSAALAKALAALWAVRAACRESLLEARTFAWLLGVWVAGAACLVSLTCLLFGGRQLPVALIALGSVLTLPLARLVAAPLALAWNRHR